MLFIISYRYNDGRLKNNLEEVFITQELKRMSQGEEISISVHIQNQEYRTACLDLMQAHVKGNNSLRQPGVHFLKHSFFSQWAAETKN